MKSVPSLNTQAKAIFIGKLFGIMFQFLIPVILVRLISKEDFGVFRQFQLVASAFLGFLAMGYQTSLFYFYPITDEVGKKKIVQQTQFLFFINSIFFIIIFYLFGDRILIYLNFAEFRSFKLSVASYIIFMLMSSVVNIIFTLEKNTSLNKIYPSFDNIAKFLIFIATILMVPGVKGPILALIFYSIIRMIYYIIHMYPYFKEFYRIDYILLKKQLFYSIPFGFALILNMISSKFDKFFINQYITPEEFGVYSVAFLGIPILSQFFTSIHNVVVPQISIYIKENKIKEATKLWKKMVDKTSNITIPAVFIFLLLADEIITILYTKDFIEAANYYRIFILSFFVSMFSYNIILRASNKTRYILIVDVIATILTVIVGLYLIPKFGLYGAVITALMGKILPMLFSLHIERKIMNQSFINWVNWKDIGINFLISIVVALILFILKDFVSNIYLRFLLTGFVFLVSIIVLQIKFKIFIFHQYISSIKNGFRINS